MNKKITLSTIAGIALLMGTATPVQAGANVGSCVNPQATLVQTNYNDQNGHGVVFEGKSYSGIDKIYKNGDNVLQCLCTVDGQGKETLWAVPTDNADEQRLINEGYKKVENPESWGLPNYTYYAKNASYVCRTPEATAAPTQAPTTTPAPVVEATKSVVNTIASTGNSFVIYASILAGAASLIAGMVLKRFSK